MNPTLKKTKTQKKKKQLPKFYFRSIQLFQIYLNPINSFACSLYKPLGKPGNYTTKSML